MSSVRRMAVVTALLALGAAPLLPSLLQGEPAKDSKPKGSKDARKRLGFAVKLLNAGRIEKGIEAIRDLQERHPNDPYAEKATTLLRPFGVGDEIWLVFHERKNFHKRLKWKEQDLLEQAEALLEETRKQYSSIRPFFETAKIRMNLYESQARYRKETKQIHTGGHFSATKRDYVKKEIHGKIDWFVPPWALTRIDRDIAMRSTMYHEFAHYLSYVHFGGLLPSIFEEGVASYFETRLNTEPYQSTRVTEQESTESEARSALNMIKEYADFQKFVVSERGFGKGGANISRWYAIGYAMVDFFERGEIKGKRGSVARLLRLLQELTRERLEEAAGSRKRPARIAAQSLLEVVISEFYGVDLKAFHRALTEHILKTYRQR